MAMADGMPKGSTLYTCELEAKAARLAREAFSVSIELLEGEAMNSLHDLAAKKLQFDAVFLDADKGNYVNYFNFILENDLLANHGYIVADNVLFSGLVLHSEGSPSSLPSPPVSPQLAPQSDSSSKSEQKRSTKLSRQKAADRVDAFNKHVKNDPRVDVVLLPIFDGLSVIMRKKAVDDPTHPQVTR
ncbi:hypothetical protein BGZ65_002954, partial [Modicella reniformis]